MLLRYYIGSEYDVIVPSKAEFMGDEYTVDIAPNRTVTREYTDTQRLFSYGGNSGKKVRHIPSVSGEARQHRLRLEQGEKDPN